MMAYDDDGGVCDGVLWGGYGDGVVVGYGDGDGVNDGRRVPRMAVVVRVAHGVAVRVG